MRKLLLLAGLFLAQPAHAATLAISGTVPALDNYGTCAAPSERVNANDSDSAWVQVRWTGASIGSDSLRVRKGNRFTFNLTGVLGTYALTFWPVDRGGVGCTTTTTRTITDGVMPARIVLEP